MTDRIFLVLSNRLEKLSITAKSNCCLANLGILVYGGLHVGPVPEDAPRQRPAVLGSGRGHHGSGRGRSAAAAGLLQLRDQVEPDGHLVRAVVVGHSRGAEA